MPLTIIKSDGTVHTTPPMYQKENADVAEIDKSNEIETGDAPNPGEKVAITNPIEPVIYYSDQPGAGPNDAPKELTTEEQAQATEDALVAEKDEATLPPKGKK